jgi:hypothetical protein
MSAYYHNVKKRIFLKKLNYSFDIHVNNHTLESILPVNLKFWINKQMDYSYMNKNTIDYELFMLLINHSMKIFNYMIDPSKLSQIDFDYFIKIWNKIKIKPEYGINKTIEFIKKSPKCSIDMYVYSGISYDDFIRLNVNPYYINNRFMSTSFDILHAMKYAYMRKNKKIINNYPLFLLKIKIKKNTSCIYSIYENQIVLPPNIKIQLNNSEFEYYNYKDILDKKMSHKKYLVLIIDADIFE